MLFVSCSLRSTLGLQYDADKIAATALYLAMQASMHPAYTYQAARGILHYGMLQVTLCKQRSMLEYNATSEYSFCCSAWLQLSGFSFHPTLHHVPCYNPSSQSVPGTPYHLSGVTSNTHLADIAYMLSSPSKASCLHFLLFFHPRNSADMP